MPAPGSATYSVAALVAAHTAFRDMIDSGPGAGTIKVRTSADALLGTITLTDPCGAVNGSTGQVTITAAAASTAAASGTAAYGELCDSTGAVHLALPAEAGSTPVSGKIVLNSLSFVNGGPIALVSCTIG